MIDGRMARMAAIPMLTRQALGAQLKLTIVPFNCGSPFMMWAGKEGWTIQYPPAPGEDLDHKAPFSVTHMYWL
jgi:hypothetical protein